jgi:hypothetical protein
LNEALLTGVQVKGGNVTHEQLARDTRREFISLRA